MLTEALTALQELAPVAALRASRWTYAGVNAAHIAGIALLFGAIVPLDLRLMGLWRQVPVRTLARVLVPVAATGLVLAVAAGAMLFSIRAVEYAGTTLFQAKMLLVLAGIANALLVRKLGSPAASLREDDAASTARWRVAGVLSLAIWLAAIVCGRMLAFLE